MTVNLFKIFVTIQVVTFAHNSLLKAIFNSWQYLFFFQAKLRMDIHALYASLLVGLCPCHGYNKSQGRTGGFYHLVCRHGVSTEIYFVVVFIL